MTTAVKSDYVDIIRNKKILYMPSCLVVEMMTKLYSQVSLINLSGNLHSVVPDLLILLRRLNRNLHATAEAYRDARIKFFIGDWREDKLRARRLFFNLMSRLGYLSELVGAVERRLIYKTIEDMGNEWALLDRIMESRCAETGTGKSCGTCRYFRCQDPKGWRQVMANVVLYLDAVTEYPDDDTYLLLLCYKRIRTQLLQEIGSAESKTGAARKFSPERILCVSDEDFPITCPNCSCLTDGSDTRVQTRVMPQGPTRLFGGQAQPRSQAQDARDRGTRAVGTGISLKRAKETQVHSLQRGSVCSLQRGVSSRTI